MSTSKSKKYKLHSASSDGGPRPCAFFGTPEGCRKGDSCPFLHSTAPPGTPDPLNTNNSVVSSEESESESEVEKSPERGPVKKETEEEAEETKSKKKKKKRKREAEQVFAKPKGTDASFKYTDLLALADDNRGMAILPTKEGEPPAEPAASPPPKQKKAKKSKNEKAAGTADFRNLALPVSDFRLPSEDKKKSSKKEAPSTPKESTEAPARTSTPKSEIKYPQPNSTEIGRKWKDVVVKTQASPDFATNFDYSKYKEQDIPGDVWIKPKPYGDWCKGNPQAIAIDCEMCETTDPVSGQKNHSALCRISIVNAEDPEDVLLNTLVKPAWPVTDYRSWVNGITEEHLQPVQFTLRHAQAFMLALCSEETVILGHAVHNDLASMRMEHYCVGDSALLFKAKDSPTATVSLKDLAKDILKKEMPTTHDSVNDAATALKCLDYYREKKGNVEEITRTPKAVDTSNRTHHKLFVHRIPKYCTDKHLAKMFLEHTSIAPEDVEDIEFGTARKGKTHVIFRSPRHAGLAFDTISGAPEREASGRLQKKVYLRDGEYVQVRKMAWESGHTFPDGKEAK